MIFFCKSFANEIFISSLFISTRDFLLQSTEILSTLNDKSGDKLVFKTGFLYLSLRNKLFVQYFLYN